VAAARAAWPALAPGLPARAGPALRGAIARALARAKQVPTPAFMAVAKRLTGPSADVAGRLESFAGLSRRCWEQVALAAGEQTGRAPAAVRFLRANAGLYIGCVYDGHYNLSTIGEVLLKGYRELGGAQAFGAALGQAQARALARAYSPASARLQPKPAAGE
jgi:hypothetical protein